MQPLLVFVLLSTLLSSGLGAEENQSQDLWKRYMSSRYVGPSNINYQEPSSRDLDVGIGIGVKDNGEDNIYYPYNSDKSWTEPRVDDAYPDSPYVYRKVITIGKDGYPELPPAASSPRMWNIFPSSMPNQVSSPFSISVENPRPNPDYYYPRTWNFPPVQDRQVYPAYPYRNPTDKQVGFMKLRNDRGYQVTMGVPPVPLNQNEGDGVLVLEMKATLYRPV